MYQYILRRLLYAIPTLLGITMLIFLVLRILPGDPLSILYGEGGVGGLSDADLAFHQGEYDRLLALLEEEGRVSRLPREPSCRDDLHNLLVRLRLHFAGIEPQ